MCVAEEKCLVYIQISDFVEIFVEIFLQQKVNVKQLN